MKLAENSDLEFSGSEISISLGFNMTLFSQKTMLYFFLICLSAGLLAVLIAACDIWIERQTHTRLYSDIEQVPSKPLALVLGTIKNTPYGMNAFFYHRINAAAALYKAGKVQHFLLSGDNHRAGYNEPEDMRDALLKQGVPLDAMSLDFAGFRTLDSVVRAHKVFQQDDFIVISQRFHNARALFIADAYGIQAVAFNAQDVPGAYGLKVRLREVLARFKAVLDVYVLHTQPRFLGKPELIDL